MSYCITVTLSPYNDPSRDSPPAHFNMLTYDLREGTILKIGRKVHEVEVREAAPVQENRIEEGEETPTTPTNARLADENYNEAMFQNQTLDVAQRPKKDVYTKVVENIWFTSKVVSRGHAELWVREGQLYLKDNGSSSGTFLNKLRLSPSGKLSRPYPIRDGDVIQLGIDYQGRPEVGISTDSNDVNLKRKENPARFRSALKSLLNATNPYSSTHPAVSGNSGTSVDCCICLSTIGPYQALFLSPCSHCYHYKCIRYILQTNHMFQCPVCRQVANIDASVSMESLVCEDDDQEMEDVKDDEVSSAVADFGRYGIQWGGEEGKEEHNLNEEEQVNVSFGNLQGIGNKGVSSSNCRVNEI